MDTSSSLPPPKGERFTLAAEEELRIEIRFRKASSCTLTLQQGSCELHGLELPLHKAISILDGGLQLALFTWHGCTIDVECDDTIDVSYITDETNSNVAYVNTHAQLEALRDQASQTQTHQGPRVLVCGPPESGKTSLCKTLLAYAAKLGRTPLYVDLDPADNWIGVPGSISVTPIHLQALSLEAYATSGITDTSPLHLWHASLTIQPELYQQQVQALGHKIRERLANTQDANNHPSNSNGNSNSSTPPSLTKTSGIIVNTSSQLTEALLLDTIQALSIDIVLVMGQDRLYSMLRNKLPDVKIIKLPRSGGVVSRDADWLRHHRHRAVARYFHGHSTKQADGKVVHELTPFLNPLPLSSLQVYKFVNLSLSAALLPVAAQQTTEAVQLEKVDDWRDIPVHSIVAVCHATLDSTSANAISASSSKKDVPVTGVAGFCAVEKVAGETDKIHLLCPCAGNLPSTTLLMGEVSWSD